jgi:hypothetical protein
VSQWKEEINTESKDGNRSKFVTGRKGGKKKMEDREK